MIRLLTCIPFLLLMVPGFVRDDVAQAGEGAHVLCTDCHGEDNQLKAPVTQLCLTCHPARRSDHPLVAVPSRMPSTLPLDSTRTMTCLTCHEPHGKEEGSKMLRMPNEALCLDCHQK